MVMFKEQGGLKPLREIACSDFSRQTGFYTYDSTCFVHLQQVWREQLKKRILGGAQSLWWISSCIYCARNSSKPNTHGYNVLWGKEAITATESPCKSVTPAAIQRPVHISLSAHRLCDE